MVKDGAVTRSVIAFCTPQFRLEHNLAPNVLEFPYTNRLLESSTRYRSSLSVPLGHDNLKGAPSRMPAVKVYSILADVIFQVYTNDQI